MVHLFIQDLIEFENDFLTTAGFLKPSASAVVPFGILLRYIPGYPANVE